MSLRLIAGLGLILELLEGSATGGQLPPRNESAAQPSPAVPSALERATADCTQGSAKACNELGDMYHVMQGTQKQDNARAASLYEKACSGGVLDGCVNLGMLHEFGEGVRQDEGRAATYYEKACRGGDFLGCTNLALFYELGKGVPQDPRRAIALNAKACTGGYSLRAFAL